MNRREQIAKLVKEIQSLTHRVTFYSEYELKRSHYPKSKPRPKWPTLRRKRAAEIMREWRRAKMTSQNSQQSVRPAADVL
jgi:hypothetical protein